MQFKPQYISSNMVSGDSTQKNIHGGNHMAQGIREAIDRIKADSLVGKTISHGDIIRMLEIDPYSEDCDYLGAAAKEVAKAATGNKIRIGISIGVDYRPCAMNCRFCSLGEKWGIIKGDRLLPMEKIIETIREYSSKGYFQFVLRTTEFFPNDLLCQYARRIRSEVPGRYILVANTGEQTLDSAHALKAAGFNAVYHAVRLGEGRDTDFTPEERIDSVMNSKKAGLIISTGLDPIAPDQTNEEIAERLELYRDVFRPATVCTMKRVAVPGTPVYEIGEISHRRHMQILAVNRLVFGDKCVIPVHPLSDDVFDWGANHISVEIGPNPRDPDMENLRWFPFSPEEASEMVRSWGCECATIDDFARYFPI